MGRGQVPTKPVSIKWIMSDPAFEHDVRDGPAGRGYPRDFDDWGDIDRQWNYERGRHWGRRAPRSVALKRNGRVTAEALAWFARLGDEIL